MYMQRENIHKNIKLNKGAANIDQLSDRAQNTVSGKELEAQAKLHDAYLQFGQTILPIYTQALVMASNALQGFTGWMQQNVNIRQPWKKRELRASYLLCTAAARKPKN